MVSQHSRPVVVCLFVGYFSFDRSSFDASFRDLQAQLEGTENRITVARNRYIETIKNFNNLILVPPTSWTNSLMYHHEKMPQWDVSAEEKTKNEKAPEVKF